MTTFIALRVGVNASRVPPKDVACALWAGRTVRKTMVSTPEHNSQFANDYRSESRDFYEQLPSPSVSGFGSCFGVTPSISLWPSGQTMMRWKVDCAGFAAAKIRGQRACLGGRNSAPGTGSNRRHGGRGDHLYGARAPAGRGFAPIDASRGDDERVFDSLHRAGIDIKLVGNPTNGFSSF